MYELRHSVNRAVNRGSRFVNLAQKSNGGVIIPEGCRLVDPIRGLWPTPSGTRSIQNTVFGKGLRYIRSGNGKDQYNSLGDGTNDWPYMPPATSAYSLFFVVQFPAVASAGTHGIGAGSNAGGFVGCNFRPSSANAMRWIVNTSAGANIITGSTITTNTPLDYLGTWDGTTSTLYENGKLKTTSAIGGTITITAGIQPFAVGSDVSNNSSDMILILAAVFPNLCLTQTDAWELHQKPISSFLWGPRRRRRFYFNSISGTTFNQSVNANTTPAPSISRQTGKVQPTNTTPASSIVKQTGKIQSTTTTPAGSIVKQTGKVQSTTTTPLAAISKAMGKLLGANTTPAPAITRQTGKIQSTTTTPAPSMLHQESVPQTLSVDTTPVPSITTVFTPAGTATLPPHRGIVLGGKLTHRNQ